MADLSSAYNRWCLYEVAPDEWYIFNNNGTVARTATKLTPHFSSENDAMNALGLMHQAFSQGEDAAKEDIRKVLGIEDSIREALEDQTDA